MLRKIVTIDQDKCDGCGLCVPSCAEGAIRMIDGKAVLSADNLCDGLGACLGECPRDAIRIEEREADEFDEAAVEKHLAAQGKPAPVHQHAHAPQPPAAAPHGGGCPGSRAMSFARPEPAAEAAPSGSSQSQLAQWPVQLHSGVHHRPLLPGRRPADHRRLRAGGLCRVPRGLPQGKSGRDGVSEAR